MKIGILQTGHMPEDLAATCGEYPSMFATLLSGRGFDFTTYAVVDGQFPEGPTAQDGWIITGSRHGVYEDHAWLPPLFDLIRAIADSAVPLVGVCFGHQAIAKALGGDVAKFDGGWIVGPQTYAFGDHAHRLHAWHQDQVLTPPPGAQTVATGPGCAHAALHYPGVAFSVQPHPEFADPVVAGLIATRGPGVVPDALLAQAQAGLGQPLDSPALADIIAHFLRHRSLP